MMLTVNLVGKNFAVDHPVGHEEDIAGQHPGRILIRVQDGLTRHTKTHQHHKHDDHKIHHVNHLSSKREVPLKQKSSGHSIIVLAN